MLDLIRDPTTFLSEASAGEAEADCALTRAALGLPAVAEEPAWQVRALADWLATRDWWWLRATAAVTAHCDGCPARGCGQRPATGAPPGHVRPPA